MASFESAGEPHPASDVAPGGPVSEAHVIDARSYSAAMVVRKNAGSSVPMTNDAPAAAKCCSGCVLAVGSDLKIALVDTLLAERAARVQAMALQFGATSADRLNEEVARQTRDANIEIGHYEDTWEALLRGLRRSDPELFVGATD